MAADENITKRLRLAINYGIEKKETNLKDAALAIGINYTTLRNYYTGKTDPPATALKKICSWTRIKPEYILYGRK